MRLSAELNVEAFSTESGYDELRIMDSSYGAYGTEYQGSTGPQGLIGNQSDVIEFSSDGSVTRSGFRICQAGKCTLRLVIEYLFTRFG